VTFRRTRRRNSFLRNYTANCML